VLFRISRQNPVVYPGLDLLHRSVRNVVWIWYRDAIRPIFWALFGWVVLVLGLTLNTSRQQARWFRFLLRSCRLCRCRAVKC
jgi:hypothetical protein